MADDSELFYPTIAFGFYLTLGKQILHQMWVSNMGQTEWRPVPMIELPSGAVRPPSIAGYVPQEDDDDERA